MTERLKKHFDLEKNATSNQHYGIGFKEVWQVDNKMFKSGLVMHTVNWPFPSDVYAGSFMYH